MTKTPSPRWSGRCSFFGGPDDGPASGNARDDWRTEGLAIYDVKAARDPKYARMFFTPEECGFAESALARRLKANQVLGFAARFNYDEWPGGVAQLRDEYFIARSVRTKRICKVRPVDWGPAASTGRDIDLTYAAGVCLGVATDDVVEIWNPKDFGAVFMNDPEVKESTISSTIDFQTPGAPGEAKDSGRVEVSDTKKEAWETVPGAANPPGKTGYGEEGSSMLGNFIGKFVLPLVVSFVASGGTILLERAGGWSGIASKILGMIFGTAVNSIGEAEVEGAEATGTEKAASALSGTTLLALVSKIFPAIGQLFIDALVAWVNAQTGATAKGASFVPAVEAAKSEGKTFWQFLIERTLNVER